eukprot:COSAG02_NODE_50982_length_317_cov_0.706422_1_plen_40_part_10
MELLPVREDVPGAHPESAAHDLLSFAANPVGCSRLLSLLD